LDLFSLLLCSVVLRQNVVGKYNFMVVVGGADEGTVTLCKYHCLSPLICACALFVHATSKCYIRKVMAS